MVRDASPHDDSLDLSGFEQTPTDEGLSLDELSQAYAQLLQHGSEPYEKPPAKEAPDVAEAESEPPVELDPLDEHDAADDGCQLTPKSILEAMLFVGHPHNQPLTSREVAALMRGVRPAEIDDLVRELNAEYDQQGCPYQIVSEGPGYRLTLRPAFAALRDRFYGRIREARLSQAAIDTLAIVAYNQPVTKDEVEQLRGRPSGAILGQLVRRELLRIERPEARPRKPRYFTTERFLDVFGLETINELPQSQELERS
ncbi:MAG: SMC-Scp complex subunit ScpB [Pirellulaceae bacterium]